MRGVDDSPSPRPPGEVRLLRLVFDRLPALIAYWDRDLLNLTANSAYVDWFGWTPERLLGVHIRELLGEPLYEANLPFITAALAGEEQLFDRTLVDPGGKVRHSQASYVPDVLDGEVQGFFVLVTDVTPRVEAQRAMDEAQRIASLGSWTLDVLSGEVLWTDETYRIAGIERDTTLSREVFLGLVHPEDRDQLAAQQRRVMEQGGSYEMDYRLVRPSGDCRHVHSRGEAFQLPDGSVVRLSGTIQDVTETRQAARELARLNEELVRANQVKSDVIAMLGHDVRQPAQVIMGYLEELVEGWEALSEEQRTRFARTALDASLRMNLLINDILTMAKLDSGDLEVRPATVDVRTVVRDALADVAAGADVDLQLAETLRVCVDPFHLRQILGNLAGNAVRYGRPPFVLHGERQGDEVVLSVTDRGDGVPDDFVPHLFDRFKRAASGAAMTTSGSGFGLYIVQELATLNGGAVHYEAGRPHGARFVVRLPAGTDTP